MIETQIELTEHELNALKALALKTGKRENELIREAVDQLIKGTSLTDRTEILQAAFGLWKDRSDLPNFDALRNEWDRNTF